MIKYKHFLLLVVIPLSIQAQAHQNEPIYLGFGAGLNQIQWSNKMSKKHQYNVMENLSTTNFLVGYNLNNYLNFELGYLYSAKKNINQNSFRNHGASISLVSTVPISGNLSLLAEYGSYYSHNTHSLETGFSPILGAGLSYKINDYFDIRARWRYMPKVLESSYGLSTEQKIASFEVTYYPFKNNTVPDLYTTKTEYPLAQTNIRLNRKVLFDFNKTKLSSKEQENLRIFYSELVDLELVNPKIVIFGYTDHIGSPSINQRISDMRAKEVYNYLASLGLSINDIEIKGKGATDNGSKDQCLSSIIKSKLIECLAPNRHVNIEVKGVAFK